MRSVFRGPAHQLAVRMRINNCTHGHNYSYAMHKPATAQTPRVHFSAFHYTMLYCPYTVYVHVCSVQTTATVWASYHKIKDKTCEMNMVYHNLSTLNVKSRDQYKYKAVYHNCQITNTVSLSTRGVQN